PVVVCARISDREQQETCSYRWRPELRAESFRRLEQYGVAARAKREPCTEVGATVPPLRKNRGRVDILRQTAHRGGKTVTVVTGFVGIGLPEKEKLAKAMQKSCGSGGTVKEGRIEIQGDQRTEVARIL